MLNRLGGASRIREKFPPKKDQVLARNFVPDQSNNSPCHRYSDHGIARYLPCLTSFPAVDRSCLVFKATFSRSFC